MSLSNAPYLPKISKMSDQSRILIVEARFYEGIADELAKGAIEVLEKADFTYERVAVPGVFETPAAIRFAIRSMELHAVARGGYAGFIALGCVIRGETDHYEFICRSATQGLMDITLNHCVALGFGVLTCENYEQAWERAAVERKNKGADAANACLRMIELKKELRIAIQ